MSKTSSRSKLSRNEEKEAWQRHHIESLLESASLLFSRKIQMLEEMEEVTRAFHGGKLPPSPDEHEERTTLDRVSESIRRQQAAQDQLWQQPYRLRFHRVRAARPPLQG